MELSLGQVVQVKAGHPMEALGRGTVQVHGDSVKVAFPLVTDGGCDFRCLQLWFQASDLETSAPTRLMSVPEQLPKALTQLTKAVHLLCDSPFSASADIVRGGLGSDAFAAMCVANDEAEAVIAQYSAQTREVARE